MVYTKPQVIAQNASSGSYAAGCPANQHRYNGDHNPDICRNCEITQ